MIKKFKLPSGIHDHLPDDCYSRRIVEGKLIDCFRHYGYNEIETPVLERYELFDSGVGKVELSKLFKVTDVDGELLILRPDITMPISRIVCTKLGEGSHKLCYIGKSFSAIENAGKLREFTQAGVEMMGAQGGDVDIEIVMLAIKSLIAAGLEDFQIEIGHVGFFKGLLDAFKVCEEDREVLINSIESKNGIKLYNLSQEMDSRLPEALSRLPMLFGGEEVLDTAEKMCLNSEMRRAVEELKCLYAGIKALGYDKYLCFDMSSVGKMKYYSGMVMRGINKNLGRSILAGGRYDGLCDAFGKHIPAVGFAIGIGYLVTALGNQNKLMQAPRVDCVVGYSPEMMAKAEERVNSLRSQGYNAICSFATDKNRLEECKREVGAKFALYICEKGEERL